MGQEGDRIANARGVPGTLGFVAWTEDGAPVLVSSYHVLFGGGAAPGDPVWRLGTAGDPSCLQLGRVRYGRQGTVVYEGREVWVDCAVAALGDEAGSSGWRTAASEPDPVSPGRRLDPGAVATRRRSTTRAGAPPVPGIRVSKLGAATGRTRGVLMASDASEWALVDGRRYPARGQLVVRSLDPHRRFSTEGDSGAVVRDEAGRPLGLLWGANARGDALACPFGPVRWLLGIGLAQPGVVPANGTSA